MNNDIYWLKLDRDTPLILDSALVETKEKAFQVMLISTIHLMLSLKTLNAINMPEEQHEKLYPLLKLCVDIEASGIEKHFSFDHDKQTITPISPAGLYALRLAVLIASDSLDKAFKALPPPEILRRPQRQGKFYNWLKHLFL